MSDTKQLLRSLDQADAPDVWIDASSRTAQQLPELDGDPRRGGSRIAAAVLAIVISVAAIAAFVFAFASSGPGRAFAPPPPSSNPSISPALRATPECSHFDVFLTPKHELDISTPHGSGRPFRFTSDCYAAPADEPFVIVFKNVTVAEDGTGGTPQNISIYPNRTDAVSTKNGEYEVGPANHALALFVGAPVDGPGKVKYEVPRIPAGTYYIQSDYAPSLLYATLIVK
jgi:hypothetical protein